MIINISSGQSGWGEYVLCGTKIKPRDENLVKIIDGDIELGDFLSKNNKYMDSYYKIILGFKGKPSEKIISQSYQDFKDNFFIGLNEDEYHIDAVVHYDTDDTHIHCRIPKQNLLTNTHLQLYYDKIDKPRKQLIQDYISLKYGLEIARETNRQIIKEESQEYIEKWRAEHNQKSISFKTKKERATAELAINNYIKELIENDYIRGQEDIKEVLEELKLKVIKFDRDLIKDFSYVTVENAKNTKMRIKGEFYNEQFWKYNTKDRREQIKNNQRISDNRRGNSSRLEEVERELKKSNDKRFKKCGELFNKSRERAKRESKEISEYGEKISRTKQRDIQLTPRAVRTVEVDIVDKHRSNITHNIFYGNAIDKRRIKNDNSRAILERRKRETRKRTIEELRTRVTEDCQDIQEQFKRDSDKLQSRFNKDNDRKREERERTTRKLQEQSTGDSRNLQEQYARDSKELNRQIERTTEHRKSFYERFAEFSKTVGEYAKELINRIRKNIVSKVLKQGMRLREQEENKKEPNIKRRSHSGFGR